MASARLVPERFSWCVGAVLLCAAVSSTLNGGSRSGLRRANYCRSSPYHEPFITPDHLPALHNTLEAMLVAVTVLD